MKPSRPTSADQRGFAATLAAVLGICLVFMLTALNASVVGIVMPRIVAELQGYSLYPWAATAYLVGNTVMIPLTGRLGDLYGRKPFVMVSVVLFALASLACGLAGTMLQLVLARGLQGIAGGIFLGVASASVADLFPVSAERLRWQVVLSASYGLAMAVGPSFGGWVAEHTSWRWVFHVNLPIAGAALYMVGRFLPRVRHNQERTGLDLWGALMLTAAILSLLMAAEGGQAHGPGGIQAAGLWLFTGVLTVAFLRHQYRTPAPVIPPDVMDNPVARRLLLLGAVSGMIMFLLVFYTPLLLQGSLHMSPERAGLVMTPLLVCITLGSIINARVLPRLRRAERLIFWGLLANALGCVLLARMEADTPVLQMVLVFALCGLSLGFQLPNLTLQMMDVLGRRHFGVAGGLSQFTRTIGSMIGIGLASLMVNVRYRGSINLTLTRLHAEHPRLTELLSTPQLLIRHEDEAEMRHLALALRLDPNLLLDSARQGLAQGIHTAFWLCALMALVAAWIGLGLPRYTLRTGSSSEDPGPS